MMIVSSPKRLQEAHPKDQAFLIPSSLALELNADDSALLLPAAVFACSPQAPPTVHFSPAEAGPLLPLPHV
jgi:hypothetical protein